MSRTRLTILVWLNNSVRYGDSQTPPPTCVLCLPGAGLVRGHLSSGRAAGSVLVFGGRQGWRNLPPPQPHLVFLYPDLSMLLSVAAKPHSNFSISKPHLQKRRKKNFLWKDCSSYQLCLGVQTIARGWRWPAAGSTHRRSWNTWDVRHRVHWPRKLNITINAERETD